MIKRIVIITTLVIVLVSLNWFKELFAGDLNDLTPQQQEFLEKPRSCPSGEQEF